MGMTNINILDSKKKYNVEKYIENKEKKVFCSYYSGLFIDNFT